MFFEDEAQRLLCSRNFSRPAVSRLPPLQKRANETYCLLPNSDGGIKPRTLHCSGVNDAFKTNRPSKVALSAQPARTDLAFGHCRSIDDASFSRDLVDPTTRATTRTFGPATGKGICATNLSFTQRPNKMREEGPRQHSR